MSSSHFKYSNDDDQNISSPNQQSKNLENNYQDSKNQPEHIKSIGKTQKQSNTHAATKKINTDPNSQRNKLVEQHTKLKGQLKQLAAKMDQIVEKEKERKKKKISNPAQEDQRVAELKKQLKDQQIRIQKNKNEIIRLRRNLDNKYDINKIVEKQNELKHLKKQLQNLQQEKQALQKIRKTQDKAIRSGQDKQTNDKIAKMEQQLRQLTHKTKKQVQSINEKEKQIRKLHQAYIVKQQKVREIQAKAKQKRANGQQINQYTIAQLEDQIKSLQQQRIQVEKDGNERVRALERERKQLKQQLERKKLILDEKQKQLRLNQMKHKQIIRLINSNPQTTNEPIKQDKKPDAKRVIAKKGRQAPKIQDHDGVIDDN